MEHNIVFCEDEADKDIQLVELETEGWDLQNVLHLDDGRWILLLTRPKVMN